MQTIQFAKANFPLSFAGIGIADMDGLRESVIGPGNSFFSDSSRRICHLARVLIMEEEGQESSSNFDLEKVRPFLERVGRLIESGFGAAEILRICEVIDAMEHDEQKELNFPIRHEGADGHLRIGIFMDEIDAPDLYFFSPPSLATQIDDEMDKFFDELGI